MVSMEVIMELIINIYVHGHNNYYLVKLSQK
jgi:hypothetical protein